MISLTIRFEFGTNHILFIWQELAKAVKANDVVVETERAQAFEIYDPLMASFPFYCTFVACDSTNAGAIRAENELQAQELWKVVCRWVLTQRDSKYEAEGMLLVLGMQAHLKLMDNLPNFKNNNSHLANLTHLYQPMVLAATSSNMSKVRFHGFYQILKFISYT